MKKKIGWVMIKLAYLMIVVLSLYISFSEGYEAGITMTIITTMVTGLLLVNCKS